MSRNIGSMRYCLVLCTILCLLTVYQTAAHAQSAVKFQKYEGILEMTGPGTFSPFNLAGEASHLGKFTGIGEVAFVPGPDPDSETGSGVVVLIAANGDQLVGVVTWDISEPVNDIHDFHIHFSWRDSVTFSNGTVVNTTGHFVNNRPPGLRTAGVLICTTDQFGKVVCYFR